MKIIKNGILIVAGLSLLSGCSTLEPFLKRSSKSGYQGTAFKNPNRVPASIAPPADAGQSSRIDPTYLRAQADYHFALAETYSLAGDSKKAVEELRATLIYDPESPTVRTRMAQEYLQQGLLAEALEQSELAVQMDPKGLPQKKLLGRIYTGMKMYEKALEQYAEVHRIDPADPDAPLFVGALLAEMGQRKKAIQHFKELVGKEGFQEPHLAYFYIGRIQMQRQPAAVNEAQKAFEKSISHKPSFVDSVMALGRVFLKEGQPKKAVELLQSYQNNYGPDEMIAQVLVNLYIDENLLEKALGQYEIIEVHSPGDLNIKVKMALLMIETKKYNRAIRYLSRVLSEDESLDKIRFYLAAVFEETKKYQEAIWHFEQISPKSQYYVESVVHAAYLHRMEGRLEQGVKKVKEGIRFRKDVPDFYSLYASFLDEQKQPAKAVRVLENSLKELPGNIQLTFLLGSFYDKVGNTNGVIESMNRVLEKNPEHIQAMNYLAYTFAEKGIELERAESLARRAYRATPNDGYVMDTLGWVLFKRGKTEEAIVTLEKAFLIQNSESIIAEHLGDAYYKSQMTMKAKLMYQQAVRLEKNAAKMDQIQQKITAIDKQRNTVRLPASLSSPE